VKKILAVLTVAGRWRSVRTPRQTSCRKRANPDGTILGQSSTDKLGFYGATTVVRPSGNAQAAVTRGSQAGVIATYSSLQSPAAVAQGTTAEQTLTIQTGTGGTMLLPPATCSTSTSRRRKPALAWATSG
jgi:hypothetical protein